MRYVVVSVVKGKAGIFNNNLRKEVYKKFNAKSSKLPAHFTQQLMKQIYDEHSDMLSYIAVRDEDAVRQLCERHLKVIADAAF